MIFWKITKTVIVQSHTHNNYIICPNGFVSFFEPLNNLIFIWGNHKTVSPFTAILFVILTLGICLINFYVVKRRGYGWHWHWLYPNVLKPFYYLIDLFICSFGCSPIFMFNWFVIFVFNHYLCHVVTVIFYLSWINEHFFYSLTLN